ncbi:MAG: glycoside hydrolase family 2, partial [Bacteroidetes bacterium]
MRGLVFVFLCCLLLWLNACRNASVEDEPYAWDHAINFNWRFAKGDHPEAIEPGFDDSSWERVDLPHDWAISGPFDSLRADGKTGKLPWRGEGW